MYVHDIISFIKKKKRVRGRIYLIFLIRDQIKRRSGTHIRIPTKLSVHVCLRTLEVREGREDRHTQIRGSHLFFSPFLFFFSYSFSLSLALLQANHDSPSSAPSSPPPPPPPLSTPSNTINKDLPLLILLVSPPKKNYSLSALSLVSSSTDHPTFISPHNTKPSPLSLYICFPSHRPHPTSTLGFLFFSFSFSSLIFFFTFFPFIVIVIVILSFLSLFNPISPLSDLLSKTTLLFLDPFTIPWIPSIFRPLLGFF